MDFRLRQPSRVLVSCALITLFTFPASLQAQTHVVNPADLHKELVNATQMRQNTLEKAKQFFSSDMAQKALKTARIDPAQVKAAISTLSDAELAQLAARTDKLQNDFAAGQLSNRDLLIILVGLTALILIIVAVR